MVQESTLEKKLEILIRNPIKVEQKPYFQKSKIKLKPQHKKWLKFTAAAAVAVFSVSILYNSMILPKFRSFQERKQEINVTNKLLEDYRASIASILRGNAIDNEDYKKLTTIEKAINELEVRNWSNAIENDFAYLTGRINTWKSSYLAQRKKQIFDLEAKLEKEKSRYSSVAKDGVSISEEKSLRNILGNVKSLRTSYVNIDLKISSVDDLLGKVEKSIEIVKVKKYDGQKTSFYTSRLNRVNNYVESKDYSKVSKEIKNLAHNLEKENFSFAKTILDEVKNFNYFRLVKVDATYGWKKTGPYEMKAWIEPKYDGYSWCKDYSKRRKSRNNIELCRKKLIKEGHYETWQAYPKVRVLIKEAHYKKLQVFPYSNKELVVEDFIPIKK